MLARHNSEFGADVIVIYSHAAAVVILLSMELNLDLDDLKPKNATTRASRAIAGFAEMTAVTICIRQAARHRYVFNTPLPFADSNL